MSVTLSIGKAYARISKVMDMLISGSLSVEKAAYRLIEINEMAGINVRCDHDYLRQLVQDHKKDSVFRAMNNTDEDEGYDSSEPYESSE